MYTITERLNRTDLKRAVRFGKLIGLRLAYSHRQRHLQTRSREGAVSHQFLGKLYWLDMPNWGCEAVLPSVIPRTHLIASKYILVMSGSSQASLVCPSVE